MNCPLLVLGSWVGVRRPFHLSCFLTTSRMVLPQDPSTTSPQHRTACELPCLRRRHSRGSAWNAISARAAGTVRVSSGYNAGYHPGTKPGSRGYEAGFSLLTFKSSSFRADFGTGAEFETLEQQRTQARLY